MPHIWWVIGCTSILCCTKQLVYSQMQPMTHHMCDMTYSYVRVYCTAQSASYNFKWSLWLIHMCDMTVSYMCHNSSIRVTWLIHMCDTTHSPVWHDSFKCVTWLIHMCDMTHSYVWHDSFISVKWLVHMCDTTHSYAWHDSFIYVTYRCMHGHVMAHA